MHPQYALYFDSIDLRATNKSEKPGVNGRGAISDPSIYLRFWTLIFLAGPIDSVPGLDPLEPLWFL